MNATLNVEWGGVTEGCNVKAGQDMQKEKDTKTRTEICKQIADKAVLLTLGYDGWC